MKTNEILAHWLSPISTGMANFGAQYNFQSIGVALLVMSSSECTSSPSNCRHGLQASWVHGSASAVIFVGAVFGQLTMGFLGDSLGRNKGLAITLSLATISAILSAVLPSGSPDEIYSIIIYCRFFLGIGIGGVFPISAVKAAEDARSHGKNSSISSSWTFFWQMPALSAPWLIALILSFTSLSSSFRWRLILGFGAIPSALVVICLVMEPERNLEHTFLIQKSDVQLNRTSYTPDTVDSLALALSKRETYIKLLASCGAWFLFDVVVFGVTLSGGEIVNMISPNTLEDDVSSNNGVRKTCEHQLVASLLSIPATLMAIALLQRIGIKKLLVTSFLFMAFVFLLMTVLFYPLKASSPIGLFFLYCLLAFSVQSGVNITVFSLPAALFDKEVRSSLNGVAAALGKVGAFVGAYGFPLVAKSSPHGYAIAMSLCCALSVLGAWLALAFVDIDDRSATVTVVCYGEDERMVPVTATNKRPATQSTSNA